MGIALLLDSRLFRYGNLDRVGDLEMDKYGRR